MKHLSEAFQTKPVQVRILQSDILISAVIEDVNKTMKY